jgi:hypothetical protein
VMNIAFTIATLWFFYTQTCFVALFGLAIVISPC